MVAGKRLAFLAAIFSVWSFLGNVEANDLYAVARIDPAVSDVKTDGDDLELSLSLSTPVPFRVFTLAKPDRLILDFQDIDWSGLPAERLRDHPDISDIRYGVFQPGWSRMVIDLKKPMTITTAEMDTKKSNPELSVVMKRTTRVDFDRRTGAQDTGRWTIKRPEASKRQSDKVMIAIDPGHGGIDPGAVRGKVLEKDIALAFGIELAEIIEAHPDFDVYLTRDSDVFVSLRDRVQLSSEAGADLFISIHINTVTFGDATGASINTLSERASDRSARKLAELENRADLSAGLEAHVEGDDVARILVDLARVDTNARSRMLADTIVEHLRPSIGVLRTKPHRFAGFEVLKAHDMPSVLLELGFMSNDMDRKNMRTPEWRAKAAGSLIQAIEAWLVEDEARSELVLK